jgi:hypothetical protein
MDITALFGKFHRVFFRILPLVGWTGEFGWGNGYYECIRSDSHWTGTSYRSVCASGINTINIGYPTNALLAKYKKATGSKIKVITQVAPDRENKDYFSIIDEAIDFGVDDVNTTIDVINNLSGRKREWYG